MLREQLRSRVEVASKDAARQWWRIDGLLNELEQELTHANGRLRGAALDLALEVARSFDTFMSSQLAYDGPGQSPVHEAMRKRVHTTTAEQTLAQAARLMWEADLGCLPVVDAERRAVAVITDRDISMAAFVQWTHLADSTVESAMSKTVHTCSPDDALTSATELMRDKQVRRLPVVDDGGHIVGIVTLGDIARYSRLHTARNAATITDAQVAGAFAAICEPRFRSIPPPPPDPRARR
jgi:CBS domain-containing protein